jgi:CRP-like cAMP-binding protein
MTVHIPGRGFSAARPADADGRASALDHLFEGRRVHRLRKGAPLFVEGDERVFIYRIDDGLALRTRHLPNGARHVLGFAEPGDVIGLKQWEGRCAETVEAASDMVFRAVGLRALVDRMGADHLLAQALVEETLRQCRRVEDLFLCRAHQASYRMLAGFLVRMIALAGLDGDDVLRLPLSRTELADHLGFTAETASRALARLRDMGLVQPIGRRDVRILDRDRLAHVAAAASIA